MASANVEIVRAVTAPWKHGDFTAFDWAHPEIEFVIADGPSPGDWSGLAGLGEGWRDFVSAWADFRVEGLEYRELAEDQVLVFMRRSMRGKTSDIALEDSHTAALFRIGDTKITRLVLYLDAERMSRALGVVRGSY